MTNTATYTGAITIGLDATPATTNYATNIGKQSSATARGNTAFGGYARATGSESAYSYGATAIGQGSLASGSDSTALGGFASATQTNSIQIGYGTNSTANSLQIGNYQLLDTSTGLIPDARISNKSLITLATSGTIALTDNSVNTITPSGAVTFTLPTVTDNTTFHQILVQVHLSTVYTITLGTSYYFNKTAPDLSAIGEYNLIFEYDKANQYWVVGCIAKGGAS